MNKKNVLLIALEILFPIGFNVIFFLVGGHEKTGAEWTAYAFIHVAYLVMVLLPYLLPIGTATTVIGMPAQTMAYCYFLFTLVFGIIIFIANPEKVLFTVIVEVVACGLFAALLLSTMLAAEHTVDNQAVHKAQVSYIKEISARIQAISDQTEDENTKRMIGRLYDLAHASPSKTNEQCAGLEREIMDSISGLEMAVYQSNNDEILFQAKRIGSLINERNRILSSTY